MNTKTINSLLGAFFGISLLLASPAAQAQYTYTTNSGTITIDGFTGTATVVTIPLTINGLPVTQIGNSAFINDASLTSVTIPDSVTSIQAYAFEYCSMLTTVSFKGNAPTAASTAFAEDNNVTVYYLPGTTGWQSTLAGRPAVMVNTGEAQFTTTGSATKLMITGYTGPNAVVIPNMINGGTVTSIGTSAFADMTNITSVTIPASVLTIGASAFAFCTSLTNVTIPGSVTSLGVDVFMGSGLTGVVIPGSINIIPGNAFEYCTNLASVYIPQSITNISSNAFEYCSGLTNVEIPYSVTNIGEFAFGYCGSLTNVTIPGSVRTTGNSAFAYCSNLASVVIADGVFSIETNEFGYCGNLTNVMIPDTVTNIGLYAFFDCSSLASVAIPDSVIAVNYEAFFGSGLVTVTIPDSVTNIGDSAFSSCSNLTNAIIAHTVHSVSDEAFSYCPSLTSVTISNGVVGIGVGAFAFCPKLDGVTIPNTITNIGESAFYDCSGLTSITIPHSVRNIGDDAFAYCGSLGDVTLSNGVLNIGEGVYAYCTSLTNVVMPGGVTNIGQQAFYGDSMLPSIAIPAAIHTIQDATFAGCVNLTNVMISNGVVSIAEDAFYSCTGLTSITIPATVRLLGEWAFEDCVNLTSVDFKGNAPTADTTAFAGDTLATVYYVAGTTGWSNTFAGLPTMDPPSAGSLQVALTPAAAMVPEAQWQVDGGTWQSSGATVANLSAGAHTLAFNTIGGWTTPASQTIVIKPNTTAEAKGTYALSAQGIYNGLFTPAETSAKTAGMLRSLEITSSGTYSGKVLIGASTNVISGSFNSAGEASNLVTRRAGLGGPLTVQLALNWNDSPPTITGTVTGTNGGAWTANLSSELAATASRSAAYTAVVLPGGTPAGYGYMLLTNAAGAVTLSVTLADGASFSQEVPLSGTGDLPVYANLYNSTGLILGWLNVASGSPAGTLTWIKPASASSSLYAKGFTNQVAVQGSAWALPSPDTAAINLQSGQLEIVGGGLASPLAFNTAVSAANALTKLPGSPTNLLSGSINRANGLLTITFASGNGTTTGKGVVLQNLTNAAGFFLGKTNGGSILLQP